MWFDGTVVASVIIVPVGEALMEKKFDIFLRLPNGKPLWVETVDGVEKAKVHIQQFIKQRPGEYFIFSSKTGHIPHV